MNNVALILLAKNQVPLLSYEIPKDLELNIGDIVSVPFRQGSADGIVIDNNAPAPQFALKPVIAKHDFSTLDASFLQFIKKAAAYYMAESGSIGKMILPVELTNKKKEVVPVDQILPEQFQLPELTAEQQKALENIPQDIPCLIKGVTGSGKTEIYFHKVAEIIKQGKQALIMLPEIALTSQIIGRFKERFGFEPVIWNSAITKSKKQKALHGIINGSVKLVIGARSALFLPFKDLGLIVIDEEHDQSYKQDDNVTYNARDMAVLRGTMDKFPVMLCSATPSVESLHNSQIGKYKMIEVASRFGVAMMPDVNLVDMREEDLPKEEWISPSLRSMIVNSLEAGGQVLLFLNRRGYAPLMLCNSCGFRHMCPSCSSWLVYHKAKKKLECHHCGYVSAVKNICPDCDAEDSFVACGPGVERIALEVSEAFQNARVATITKDNMQKEAEIEEMISDISNHKIDIIVGTQIITKGYHFPKINLVGVIDADLGLKGGDLRTAERTFQLLHQVSGRAGRDKIAGRVALQTYNPDSLVIQSLCNNDEDKFIEFELESRKNLQMPPFARMASITLSGKQEHKTLDYAKALVSMARPEQGVKILGPAAANMMKLKNKYRFKILISAPKKYNIQRFIHNWLHNIKIPSSIHIKIDIDPYSFY